jgi:hypothetical protein
MKISKVIFAALCANCSLLPTDSAAGIAYATNIKLVLPSGGHIGIVQSGWSTS